MSDISRHPYSVLPPNLPPRLIGREAAARYMGIGTSKFDELVSDGRAPKPTRIDARTLWDVKKLDAAIDALSDQEDNPWDR